MMNKLMVLLSMLMMLGETTFVDGQEIFDANNLANVPMDMTAPLEYADSEEEMQSEKLPMKNRAREINQDRRTDEYFDDVGLDDDFDDMDADDSLTQANTSTVEDSEEEDDDTDDDSFDDNSDTLGDFMTANGLDDGETRHSLSLVPSVSSSQLRSEFTSSSYMSNPSPSGAKTQAAQMSSISPGGNSRSIVDSLFSGRMSQVTPAPPSSSIASFLMSNMPHPRVSPINANVAVSSLVGRPNSPVSSSIRQSFNNMLNQARERGFSLLQPLESAQLTSPPQSSSSFSSSSPAAANTIVVSPTIAVPFAGAPGIVLLAQMDNSNSTNTTTTTTPPPAKYADDDDDYDDSYSGGKGKGKGKGGFTVCPFSPPPQYIAIEKIIPVPRLKIYEEDDEHYDHHDYTKAKKGVKKKKGKKKGYTKTHYGDKDEGKLIILAEESDKKKDKKKHKDKEKKCKKGKCSSHILVAVDESGHSGHYR